MYAVEISEDIKNKLDRFLADGAIPDIATIVDWALRRAAEEFDAALTRSAPEPSPQSDVNDDAAVREVIRARVMAYGARFGAAAPEVETG